MNENCEKWHGQIKELREKHVEFMQTYKDALKFAEQNPKIRDIAFRDCRKLFHEIKPLVMALHEDCPRLTKEQKAELELLKTNFDALPELHEGIKWADVVRSLNKAPDAINKLRALDEKGHQMNVFGEENGEFVFVSAWDKFEQLKEDHRTICFDPKGQRVAESQGYKPNGNAVSIIAAIMGVNEDEALDYLADTKFHNKLIEAVKVSGWAWLKTDDATILETCDAVRGYNYGIYSCNGPFYCDGGSFRAALRVKKV